MARAQFLRHEAMYARRASAPFGADLGERFAHLTNVCVQKQHPRFGEDSVWCLEHLQVAGTRDPSRSTL